LTPLLLVPLWVYAYPVLRMLLARSEVPIVLGRYSFSFFVFILVNLSVIGLILWAWRRHHHSLLQFGFLALIGMTVLLPMNNQLRYLTGVVALMPAVRLTAGIGCALAEFDRHRRRAVPPRPFWIVLGVAFFALSLVDYALVAVLAIGDRSPEGGLRVEYDLREVSDRDVVLVGDSFVWGEGVQLDERFGNRLEALFDEAGERTRVYSLGETGIGLLQYEALLSEVAPRQAGQVIVAFYMNDMPPPEMLRRRVQDFAEAFGRGFASARLVGDKLARLLSGDVHAYHRFVTESYDETSDTYEARWSLLQERIRTLGHLSAERSSRPPLLMIIPIMVDFRDYPLVDAHRQVAEVAREAGFDVEDLLPVFEEALVDGDAHRASPDDNHFDARTHELVARTLYRRIAD